MEKKKIIDNVKIYLLSHFEIYKRYLWMYFIDKHYNLELSIKERDLCNIAYKLYSAWQKKKQRIKRMLDYIIMKNRKSGNVWFCTFTFSDNNINISHREIIKMFSQLDWCILNEDFGKTTNRRHYHAIIGGLDEQELEDLWDLGFTKYKRIHFNFASYEKVGAYIVKLSQHALKKEVARNLYYSKKIRFLNR